MKKRLFTIALLLSVTAVSSAKAENAKTITLKDNRSNLEEITLNANAPDKFEPIAITGGATPAESETALKEGVSTTETKKGLFPIFNLKGGVEKTLPTAEIPEAEVSKSEAKIETEKTVVKQWLDGDYATGKWFGARPLFEDHGVSIQSSLLYSPMMKTGGGANGEKSGKGYSLFNLGVTLDTEKAGLWKGGEAYVLYQRKAGYGISGANGDNGAMGDWMGLDGWDWRQINQLSEAWYQQKLFNDKLRLKVGKQDANIDFGYLNSGWNFMNTAFSVNPTTPMPTYPDQSFGFMAEINPKEWLSIKNGIYSRYNTPFNITEIEVKPTIKKMPGRYMLGAWEMSDSNGMEVATGGSGDNTIYNNFNRNFGWYAGFEQMVYKENKDDENDMQGLIVFGQVGMSPSNKNDMSKYVGGGVSYTGAIPKRDQDILGLAVANGNFAPRLADITSQRGSETAVECFYRVQVTPWVYLQPNVQLIMNPGGMYDNSVAIGLRSVITF